jgi:hypothetical protein
MPTPPVLAAASTQTPAALLPTGATTSQLTESQLALTINASQDVSLISEAGGYGLNDLLNKYIKGDAGAVVSVVLPPLLANIDIFAKFAGKFTEVMAPLLDHHSMLTPASLGPCIHHHGDHGTHCSISGKRD